MRKEYKNIGNVTCDNVKRSSIYTGLLKTPSLVLKMYELYKSHKVPFCQRVAGYSADFLEEQIEKGKIKSLSGIGFSILSEDTLNVAVWDKNCPIVLKNQIYETNIDKLDISEIFTKQLDIRKDGSFCIWELGIVNHERNAWKKYLESQRNETDKIKYLDSHLERMI